MLSRRFVRIAVIVGGTVAVCYFAAFAGAALLFASGCANEVLLQVTSPDAKMKAVVFQRDCGATTGFSTQVSIVQNPSELPNESGNAFVADTNHGAAPDVPGGGPEVSVSWLSSTELVISHHPAARVFSTQGSVGSTKVHYEASVPKS